MGLILAFCELGCRNRAQFHRAALARKVAKHNKIYAYQNRVTSQNTKSHVHFVTGILFISSKQRIVEQALWNWAQVTQTIEFVHQACLIHVLLLLKSCGSLNLGTMYVRIKLWYSQLSFMGNNQVMVYFTKYYPQGFQFFFHFTPCNV